jgi:hypothetical protein
MDADRELIKFLGGPTKVAALLNLKQKGSVQRVQNWYLRGIPAKVKLQYPEVFLAPRKSSEHSTV